MDDCDILSSGDGFNYLADDAEAVVFTTAFKSGFSGYLYVMTRKQAQAFCSRPETAGQRRYGGDENNGKWMCVFSTHVRDWRDKIKSFRVDDGRFNRLLDELGIVPIYRGGDAVVPMSVEKIKPKTKPVYAGEKLTLCDRDVSA